MKKEYPSESAHPAYCHISLHVKLLLADWQAPFVADPIVEGLDLYRCIVERHGERLTCAVLELVDGVVATVAELGGRQHEVEDPEGVVGCHAVEDVERFVGGVGGKLGASEYQVDTPGVANL